VNSCILQGIVTAAASTECVCSEQMCFIGTGSLVRLCLCKLQWYSDCVLPSAGVPQATLGVLQAHLCYSGTGKCDFDNI